MLTVQRNSCRSCRQLVKQIRYAKSCNWVMTCRFGTHVSLRLLARDTHYIPTDDVGIRMLHVVFSLSHYQALPDTCSLCQYLFNHNSHPSSSIVQHSGNITMLLENILALLAALPFIAAVSPYGGGGRFGFKRCEDKGRRPGKVSCINVSTFWYPFVLPLRLKNEN